MGDRGTPILRHGRKEGARVMTPIFVIVDRIWSVLYGVTRSECHVNLEIISGAQTPPYFTPSSLLP